MRPQRATAASAAANNMDSVKHESQEDFDHRVDALDAPAFCTIACQKGHLTAHKLILCEYSKYLQDILSNYPNAEHPIVILTELNITDIRILVNFMYTGELVITNDTSPTSLLRAAQILKIDSLTADDNGCSTDDSSSNNASSNNNHNNNNNNISSSSNNNNNNYSNGNHSNNITGNTHSNNNNNNNNHLSLNNLSNHLSGNDSISNNHLSISNINKNNNSIDSSNSNNDSNNGLQDVDYTDDFQDLQDLQDSKNNKIRCHLCNIGLSDVKCLYRHVLTRHLPEKWGYKCEFCDREFSRDDHLMRHYTTKHKNMEFDREKIRETRRLNREMAKNFHDQISKV